MIKLYLYFVWLIVLRKQEEKYLLLYNRQRNKELVINKLNSTFYCELQMCTLSKTSEKLENIAGYNTFLHSVPFGISSLFSYSIITACAVLDFPIIKCWY